MATDTPYLDPTGDTATDRVDRERERLELGIVAGMAIQSLMSRRANNEQCADMVRGLSRWWRTGPRTVRDDWAITDHAATRAVQMGLTADDVLDLLYNPDDTRVQGPRSAYAGDVLHFRGDYTAAIAHGTYPRVVITFLYRYQDDYDAQYDAPLPGRERRESHLPRKAA